MREGIIRIVGGVLAAISAAMIFGLLGVSRSFGHQTFGEVLLLLATGIGFFGPWLVLGLHMLILRWRRTRKIDNLCLWAVAISVAVSVVAVFVGVNYTDAGSGAGRAVLAYSIGFCLSGAAAAFGLFLSRFKSQV